MMIRLGLQASPIESQSLIIYLTLKLTRIYYQHKSSSKPKKNKQLKITFFHKSEKKLRQVLM